MKSMKDVNSIDLQWEVPRELHVYKKKPLSFLSHLLGHESAGSILYMLKVLGWAQGLSSGEMRSMLKSSIFMVKIQLTPEGKKNWVSVVSIVYQYLHMLSVSLPQKWIFDEEVKIRFANWRFKEKENPYAYAETLARRMHDYPAEDLLSGPFLYEDYDEVLILDMLKLLTPERCLIMYSSRDALDEETSLLTEPWYGVEYSVTKITDEIMGRWTKARFEGCESVRDKPVPALELPIPNPFVASDFSILKAPGVSDDASRPNPPNLLIDETALRVWHKQDTLYERPVTDVRLSLTLPQMWSSADDAAAAALLCGLITNTFADEVGYMAELAGAQFSGDQVRDRLVLVCFGYSETVPKLVKLVCDYFANAMMPRSLFDTVRHRLLQDCENWMFGQPYSHATMFISEALRDPYFNWDDLKKAVVKIDTPEALAAAASKLWRNCYMEALVHGNMAADGASELMREVYGIFATAGRVSFYDGFKRPAESPLPTKEADVFLPAGSEKLRICEIIDAPIGLGNSCIDQAVSGCDGSATCYEGLYKGGIEVHSRCPNEEEPNGVVEFSHVAYQMEPNKATRRQELMLDLLCQLSKQPAFSDLRTRQQLGYVVFSGKRAADNLYTFRVLVQSEKFGPDQVRQRIDTFLKDFYEIALLGKEKVATEDDKTNPITPITEKDWETTVNTLIALYLKKAQHLRQESSQHWMEIIRERYEFTLFAENADYLREGHISLQDVAAFYHNLVLDPNTRRRLGVFVYGKDHSPPEFVTQNRRPVALAPKSTDSNALCVTDLPSLRSRMGRLPHFNFPVPQVLSS
eukprot:Rmarinus@m.6325